jgi:hypothetical protein
MEIGGEERCWSTDPDCAVSCGQISAPFRVIYQCGNLVQHTRGTEEPPLIWSVLKVKYTPCVTSQLSLKRVCAFIPDLRIDCDRVSVCAPSTGKKIIIHRDILILATAVYVIFIRCDAKDRVFFLAKGVYEGGSCVVQVAAQRSFIYAMATGA